MPTNNKSIQILRGDKSSLSDDLKKTKLEPGQPFFDKDAKTLQVGDGSGVIGDNVPSSDGSNLATAPYVTVKDGAIITSKLADASNDETSPTGVTTEKIENRAITSDKLGDITKIALTTGEKPSNYITTWRESSGVSGQVTVYRSKQLDQKTVLKENIAPIIWGDIVVFARTGVEVAEPAVKGRSLYLETTASSSLTGDTDYYANKRFTRISEDSIGLNVALNTDSVSGAIRLGYPTKSGTLALESQVPTFQSINGNLYITTKP